MKKIFKLCLALALSFSFFLQIGDNKVRAATTTVSSATDLVNAFKNGGEITVSNNGSGIAIDFQKLVVPEGKEVVLDLNGHTITINSTIPVEDATLKETSVENKDVRYSFDAGIYNQGTLIIKNGTIGVGNIGNPDGIYNTGNLIIEDSATIRSLNNGRNVITNVGGTVETSGVLDAIGGDAIVTYGGLVTINGGTINAKSTNAAGVTAFNRAYNNNSEGAVVSINGGTITSDYYAVSTNNLLSGGNNGSNLTIAGGALTSNNTTTVYWPSSGTLTIGAEGTTNGPTITSVNGSALEVCSGTVNIYGGTLESKSSSSSETTDQWLKDYRTHSGTSGIGDAVTVIARRGQGYDTAPLSVNISGGTFTSASNYGVRMLDCNLGNESQIDQNISLAITDGNFSGGLGAVDAQYLNESEQKVISGGSFSSDVKDYMTEESKVVQTDTGYQIVPVTTGVALDKTSITLNEKETTTLTATLAPEGAVETLKWTTDNDKVATVDENGKVTAVAPGKATITVKAGTFEATCTVTVNAVSEVIVETPAIDTTNKDEVQAGLTAGDQTAAQEVIKDTVEQIKDVAGNEQTVVNAVSTAVTEGKDITTELVINKVEEKEVASEDVTAVETALSYLQDKAGATSGTVAQYLDINVLVKVDGTTVGELNQLSKEITVSIAIPTELQTEGRQFYVIRVHGDEITRLPLTKNADGTYSFKTDRFSTYALVYVDGATESYLTGNESIAIKPVTTPPTSGNTETTKPNTETPETSAAMFGGMFATMAVLSAGIAVVLWKKRELSK